MKVDVLALGMLSCLRRGARSPASSITARSYCARHAAAGRQGGLRDALARRFRRRVPGREPRADVDAAAPEAAMLLRPRHRGGDRAPGPDPGRHGASLSAPARRHRAGTTIPRPIRRMGPPTSSKNVLKRTLGVPLFQEQAMQIAIAAAKFTPDEADGLRRAMATFRHNGTVHLFREKFIDGMISRGYDRRTSPSAASARSRASANTAFPKATRRALRCSSMPRPGSSATIRTSSAPPSSTASRWASISRPSSCATRASTASRCAKSMSISATGTARWSRPRRAQRPFAVRLGFRQIQGLNEDELEKLIAARGNGYASIERLAAVAGVSRFTIERLAEADAFRSLGLDRRAALWAARRLDTIGIRKRWRQKHGSHEQCRPPASAARAAHERRAFPGAGGRAAADAARASTWWRTTWRPACR